jgi:hypothetical protein
VTSENWRKKLGDDSLLKTIKKPPPKPSSVTASQLPHNFRKINKPWVSKKIPKHNSRFYLERFTVPKFSKPFSLCQLLPPSAVPPRQSIGRRVCSEPWAMRWEKRRQLSAHDEFWVWRCVMVVIPCYFSICSLLFQILKLHLSDRTRSIYHCFRMF